MYLHYCPNFIKIINPYNSTNIKQFGLRFGLCNEKYPTILETEIAVNKGVSTVWKIQFETKVETKVESKLRKTPFSRLVLTFIDRLSLDGTLLVHSQLIIT